MTKFKPKRVNVHWNSPESGIKGKVLRVKLAIDQSGYVYHLI